MADFDVYVGSYTSNGGEGIYILSLNAETGELKHRRTVTGVVNPSYLALDAGGRRLYAVNEVEVYYGRREGALSAFAIDPATGDLRFLNQQPSGGASPCHLSLDHSGKFLFVANYGGGSVASFPLQPDGGIAPCSGRVQHEGAGAHPVRQQAPHAHCVVPDPFNRRLIAVDLGTDSVTAYEFDGVSGDLGPAKVPSLRSRPGSGPRHLAFHPDGKWAYVVHELEARISRYVYDGMTGGLEEADSVSCLPPDFTGENFASALALDPSGRYLYVSNRGLDGISHFRIGGDGSLSFRGSQATRGRFPRDFAIDPPGRFLIAANQRSDGLSVFRIEAGSGDLEYTGFSLRLPSPACVRVRAPLQR